MIEKSLNLLQPGRGTKRLCQDCGVRYYDLGQSPVICPKCGVTHIEAPPRLPAARKRPRGGWVVATAEAGPAEASEAEESEDDGEGEPEDAAADE